MNKLFARLTGTVLLGYLLMGKSFAYLGVPAAKLFIGDILLALWLVCKPGAVIARWLQGLIYSTPLNRFCWMYLVFVQYGILQALRGFSEGYEHIAILQELVFNIYPLYLFVAVDIGLHNPGLLRTLIRMQVWCTGLYGVAYILVLNRLDVFMPGTMIPMFGQTAGSFAILSILCLERSLMPFILPLCLNAFVMLGTQVRAEWLGFVVGLTIWAVVAGQIKRLLAGFALVGFVLLIGYATDFEMDAPRGRGGKISVRAIASRAVASVSQQAAADLSEDAATYAGTVSWRKNWWAAIWKSTHQNLPTAALGHGYGFRIADLVYYLEGDAIRTPHNDFYYALGYTGWIGVFIFYAFLFTLGRLVWDTYQHTGEPLGLVLMSAVLSQSLVGNLFETPFGAIPSYFLIGLTIAPHLQVDSAPEDSESLPVHPSVSLSNRAFSPTPTSPWQR